MIPAWLAVRNSGGLMVVEGCGDHGCEYMTNGVVVLLGETGRNFGAGMSGGLAFVLDLEGKFEARYNPGMVRIERLSYGIDADLPRELIERHARLTRSRHGNALLSGWDAFLPKFWKGCRNRRRHFRPRRNKTSNFWRWPRGMTYGWPAYEHL